MYWGYNILQNHLVESIIRSRNRNETICTTKLGHTCYTYTYSDLKHSIHGKENSKPKCHNKQSTFPSNEKSKWKTIHETELLQLATQILPQKNY